MFRKILLVTKIYILVISLFFIFRLILFISEIDRVNLAEVNIIDIFMAFGMGIRFDIVISGYILFLPVLILFVSDALNLRSRYLNRIFFYWIFILFTIAFLICTADIPYFNQFFSRFSITAFAWAENAGFVITMILQEPRYFLFIIPFLIVVVIYYKILKSLFRDETGPIKTNVFVKSVVYLIFLFVIFIGIRGRVHEKSPIRIGTAYFSNDPFLNQLGLNPVFTLVRSYLDSKDERNKTISLIDDQEAINYVRENLNLTNSVYNSPIARKISPDSVAIKKLNVVIIIMESMSAAKMSRHGNQNNLTPFLDSLANKSIYFDNIYTAGIHTFNGVFSTLFSFPGLYRQHPMKKINKYNNISNTLLKHNYQSAYFTTHDGQFDNVEGFLKANDFKVIITQNNYPISKVKSTLGVPDDFMFRYSIPILNQLHSENKPFFAAFMTTSDHGPYYFPSYFKPKSDNIKNQIVEYADWSLNQFISLASKTSWFKNTIFVFIADHGAPLNVTYEIPLNYFHTPLIFYTPDILDSIKTYQCIGGQIDVFPTIMGLLNLPYVNNTLGIDLLKEKRPFIYINGDDKIGVLDNEHLLILRKSTENDGQLFRYKSLEKSNCISEYPKKAKKMEIYAKSNLQVFQYMLNNNLLYEEYTLPNKK